jgi:hypothetical protein
MTDENHKQEAEDWDEYGRELEQRAHDSFERFPLRENGPSKIEPNKLFEKVYNFLGRFVCYPSEHAHVAHLLWIAHAHCMNAWESTPRIAFLSPEPASGKTRALEVTELLVPNAVENVNMTPA